MNDALPPRKYIAEHIIGLFTQGIMMIPPDQLNHPGPYPEEIDDYHIYLICKRPRLSFKPKSLKNIEEDIFEGHLSYKEQGKEISEKFITRISSELEPRVSPYPHNKLLFSDGEGEGFFIPQHVIMQSEMNDKSFADLEVMYVGQAFGDGTRSAFERLKSHSTLQQILADISTNTPDDEVMLLLFDYAPCQIISNIDGRQNAEKTLAESDKIFVDIMQNPLTEKQQISIAEAGLIRYFEPHYNKIYKKNFPAQNQKLLHSCYELDFAGVVVEINCEDINSSIYSSAQPKGVHHISQYDLHDTTKRRTFFGLVADDEFIPMQGSGPIY